MIVNMAREQYGDEAGELVDKYMRGGISRRQFAKGLFGLGIGMGAASAILAACGGSDDATSGDATTDTGATDASSAPKVGGQLREGYNRDVSKHDPITTNWYDPAFSCIYETVVTFDLDGAVVPQFASGYNISDDGLTYTFDIPEGRVSHSGGAVGAKQVAELLQVIKDTSFIGGVSTVPMEGYSAEGNQVVMKMKNAWLGALNPHTTGYWALTNIDTWKAAGGSDPSSTYGTETADGTGPFTHTEWVPGSHSLVTRWDEYPGNNTPFIANKGTAYLDSIRWSVITEAGQRATQLESGDLDTLIGPSYADLDRLRGNSDLTVIQHPEWSGYHLVMNRDYPEFFGDMLTRQGLSHALNRQGMVDAILFGNGDPTYGPFPKTDRQYEPKVEEYNQYELSEDDLGDMINYIEDGMTDVCEITFYNERPISLTPPKTVVRVIEYSEPAARGDTSGKVMKTARLMNGFELQVAAFCDTGDAIEIDTATNEYKSRVKL